MTTRDDGGQKSASRKTEEVDEVDVLDTSEVQERQAELTDDVDDILDEIDSVLEQNAEEFVRGYVQKGGSESTYSSLNEVEMKRCLDCGELKPLEDFSALHAAGATAAIVIAVRA